ncbi:hypothetical protein NP233_g9186 [Leucocoprinus birnbaumii]|uniref:DUF6533 domain-containing protein n=1 Tax=Leucocoprinus birnbaumii TaxID=56174 RepID=A0AAD5VKW8_9AGAR|nr:hypothetical protein NP233_g9186 [Leucocoprinus birnbaumii]
MKLTEADYESLQVNWILSIVSMTLIIYDYLLTFNDEVERFWPRRLKYLLRIGSYDNECNTDSGPHDQYNSPTFWSGLTWAALLFCLNRCKHLQVFHQYMVLIIQALVASMMTMRVYALYDRKLWIVILFIIVCSSAVGVATWAIMMGTRPEVEAHPSVVPTPYGCGMPMSETGAHYVVLAWTGELVFDILVFGMTLYKTLTLPRGGGIGLVSKIMRDGTMYFGAMVLVNVGNFLCLLLGGPLSRSSVTMLTNVISSVMVSRLMLNLRDPKLRHSNGQVTREVFAQESTINGLGFRRAGNESWFGMWGIMTTGVEDSRI